MYGHAIFLCGGSQKAFACQSCKFHQLNAGIGLDPGPGLLRLDGCIAVRLALCREWEMPGMTGGGAIVATLLRHSVDTVFGLPGAQIYGLFDALHAESARIRVVGARHEQGCAYMALGYARSTGRAGVYSVVPGPGMLNTAAALLTAYGCNAPVLCLTGQVPTAFFGRGRGHLHEMRDQLGTMRGLVKWAERIEHPVMAPGLVAQAFQQMLSGRPGPAALEMFWDRFTEQAEVEIQDPLLPLAPPPVDLDRIDAAVKLIRGARAPMILVGGGAIDAVREVRELAEMLEAPVVALRNGRGIVSEADDLGLNIASGHGLWQSTDLLIGIGSRLEISGWRWGRPPSGLKSIRIDIDPAEARRVASDVDIIADAALATRALVDAARRNKVVASGRLDAIRSAKAKTASEIEAVQPQIDYLKVIREVLPPDGFFVDDLSQVGFTSWFGFPVYRPRSYISSGYQGTLGSGFGTALGVKVANPDKPVISVCGDGGFMFAVQELATAVQYGIGVIVVVFNNSSFANVRRDQQRRFEGRVIGADLVNPDFVKLAESFGVAARRVGSPAELKPVLERAFAQADPMLIEVTVERGMEASPWPFIDH
jgi:acetolactate synthase-1/2/3 large subunit